MRGKNTSTTRSHLAAGGAVVGAGILALALVAVPPNSSGARTIEVGSVHLAVFAMPSAVPSPAILEKLFSRQDGTGVVVTPLGRDASGTVVAVVKTSTPHATTALTLHSAIDPATNDQEVKAAALEAPTAAGSILDPILGIVAPILGLLANPGALLLFAPIILLVILACPPCALFNFITFGIQSFLIDLTPVPLAVAAPSTAVADATAAIDPSLSSDSPPVTMAAAEPADSAPATEPGKPPLSRRVRSTEPEIASEEMSTYTAASATDPPQTATAAEASTEPTTAAASDPSANASTSETTKPTARQATPRPVVRHSLKSGEQLRDPAHRGNGGHPTTKTAVASDSAATAGPSSGDDSSGDDAGGS